MRDIVNSRLFAVTRRKRLAGYCRMAIAAWVIVWTTGGMTAFGQTGGGASPSIDDTKRALEKWVETQRVISQEKRDFAIAREMLNERINLVQREIQSLRDRIRDAESSIAEADRDREKLIQENEQLREASSSLGEILIALESRVTGLLVRLPEPIRERVKPLSQRIPDDPESASLSLSERFQNVVGILNEINKFNRDITVTSEVRPLPDGTSAEVTALYLGLGQGFYTGAKGTVAGVGTATPDGWTWTPANDAAAEIARAIAILKNEEVASFVPVPVTIQ